MNQVSEKQRNVRVLQTETCRTETFSAEYILMSIETARQTYYAIEICSSSEGAMELLGTDFERVQRYFEIMVNETVTPCTLRDVVHDMICGEEERCYRKNLCKI